MNVDERRELTRAALDYWTDFDSRIPRNSPSEAEWLEQELATTDMARLGRAINSVQYGQDQLVQLTTFCIDAFRVLDARIGSNKPLELYLWLRATRCYTSNAADYLRAAGLSDGKNDGAFKMMTFGLIHSIITGKLADSVIGEP